MERFGISVAGQTRELLWFTAVGVLLGVWYEVFRTGRLIVPPSAHRVFFEDIAAGVGAAFITQAAALPISSGRVRLVHLLCLLCGASVYYFTAGRLIYAVLRVSVRLTERVGEVTKRIFLHVARKTKNICKKALKICKKPLQHKGRCSIIDVTDCREGE